MRKRRSEEQWREIVGRWRASGQSAREFAAHEGVVAGTLSWWGNRLKAETPHRSRAPKAKRPAFAPLHVTSSSSPGTGGRIEVVTPGGLVVRVIGSVSDVELSAVLRAVQPC